MEDIVAPAEHAAFYQGSSPSQPCPARARSLICTSAPTLPSASTIWSRSRMQGALQIRGLALNTTLYFLSVPFFLKLLMTTLGYDLLKTGMVKHTKSMRINRYWQIGFPGSSALVSNLPYFAIDCYRSTLLNCIDWYKKSRCWYEIGATMAASNSSLWGGPTVKTTSFAPSRTRTSLSLPSFPCKFSISAPQDEITEKNRLRKKLHNRRHKKKTSPARKITHLLFGYPQGPDEPPEDILRYTPKPKHLLIRCVRLGYYHNTSESEFLYVEKQRRVERSEEYCQKSSKKTNRRCCVRSNCDSSEGLLRIFKADGLGFLAY